MVVQAASLFNVHRIPLLFHRFLPTRFNEKCDKRIGLLSILFIIVSDSLRTKWPPKVKWGEKVKTAADWGGEVGLSKIRTIVNHKTRPFIHWPLTMHKNGFQKQHSFAFPIKNSKKEKRGRIRRNRTSREFNSFTKILLKGFVYKDKIKK